MTVTYRVIIKGIDEGKRLDEVANALSVKFTLPVEKAYSLLSSCPIVVKRELDFASAGSYMEALHSVGCTSFVEPEQAPVVNNLTLQVDEEHYSEVPHSPSNHLDNNLSQPSSEEADAPNYSNSRNYFKRTRKGRTGWFAFAGVCIFILVFLWLFYQFFVSEQESASTIALVTVGVFSLPLLIAGGANKVVIYYDLNDFSISGLGALLTVIGVSIFFGVTQESGEVVSGLVSIVMTFIGLFCIWKNFKNSIKHTRSVPLGIFVGTFKIIFSVLAVLIIAGHISKALDEKSSRKDIAAAVFVLIIFIVLTNALINGPEVYEEKGWDLFDADFETDPETQESLNSSSNFREGGTQSPAEFSKKRIFSGRVLTTSAIAAVVILAVVITSYVLRNGRISDPVISSSDASPTPVDPAEREVQISRHQTSFGDLTVIQKKGKNEFLKSYSFLLSGRPIYELESTPTTWVDKIFELPGRTVILLTEASEGVACPTNYQFITIKNGGVVSGHERLDRCQEYSSAEIFGNEIRVVIQDSRGLGDRIWKYSEDKLSLVKDIDPDLEKKSDQLVFEFGKAVKVKGILAEIPRERANDDFRSELKFLRKTLVHTDSHECYQLLDSIKIDSRVSPPSVVGEAEFEVTIMCPRSGPYLSSISESLRN